MSAAKPDWYGRRARPLPPAPDADPRLLATPRDGPWGSLGQGREQGGAWARVLGSLFLAALLGAFLWAGWAPVLGLKTGP